MLSALRITARRGQLLKIHNIKIPIILSQRIQIQNVPICIQTRAISEVRYVQQPPSSSETLSVATPSSLPTDTLPPVLNKSVESVSYDSLPSAPKPLSDNPVTEYVVDPSLFNALGEPSLESMGLGGWYPTGMVQQGLEFFHVSLGLPWWGSIVLGTLIIRVALFPLIIKSQKNNATMNNHLPQMQALQMKMQRARETGNHYDSARYGHEMMQFMKEKKLNPLKNLLVPMAQAPVFISCFLGLRKMANYPMDSLTTGGMLWFTDLTVPDPYYILPLLTSLTLWATIEVGTDAARVNQSMPMAKYVLRALPIIMFPFTMNFPGAILCYWLSTNLISLGQVAMLRIPRVRDAFDIPKLVKHNPEDLPVKKKGFVKTVSNTWTNYRLSRELDDRAQLDELMFNKAGKGPVKKTYKVDPTKIASAIIAKKKTS